MKLSVVNSKLLEYFLYLNFGICVLINFCSIINYSKIMIILEDSKLLHAIQNSSLLLSFQISGIFVSFPMIIDLILDYNNFNNFKGSVFIDIRIIYVIVGFTFPCALFLGLRHYAFYSYIYILIINVQFLFVALMCVQDLIRLNLKTHLYAIVAVGLFMTLMTSQILYIYGAIHLLPITALSIGRITYIIFELGFIILLFTIARLVYLERYSILNGKHYFNLKDNELQCMILNLIVVFLMIVMGINQILIRYTLSWFDLNEENLVFYFWIGIVWVIIATILPGKFKNNLRFILLYICLFFMNIYYIRTNNKE